MTSISPVLFSGRKRQAKKQRHNQAPRPAAPKKNPTTPASYSQEKRIEFLKQLEDPDTFRTVFSEAKATDDPNILILSRFLQEDGMTHADIYGDTQRGLPENPALKANLHEYNARRLQTFSKNVQDPLQKQFTLLLAETHQDLASTIRRENRIVRPGIWNQTLYWLANLWMRLASLFYFLGRGKT